MRVSGGMETSFFGLKIPESVTKKLFQKRQLTVNIKTHLNVTFCCYCTYFKKCHDYNYTENLTAQSTLFISTGIHLSPKIADMPKQVLYSTNSASAETNYVLFP